MKIEYVPTQSITPYLNNAKKHPEEQIEQIKKSIKEFGMNDPIAVWSEACVIVEGHGRYFACKELGMKQVPIIRLDSLTDEQRKAYTLVHNKLALETGFDFEMLEHELEQIGNGLSVYGISKSLEELDMDELQAFFDEDEEKKPDNGTKIRKYICPHCGQAFERE